MLSWKPVSRPMEFVDRPHVVVLDGYAVVRHGNGTSRRDPARDLVSSTLLLPLARSLVSFQCVTPTHVRYNRNVNPAGRTELFPHPNTD